MTFPAVLSPKLLKPAAPVASPVDAAPIDFAALLESFHADAAASLQDSVDKKESASSKQTSRPEETAPQSDTSPKLPAPTKTPHEGRTHHIESNDLPQQKLEEEPVQANLLTILLPVPPSRQDALPLAFTLPAPVAIQNEVESASLVVATPDLIPEQSATPLRPRQQAQSDSQPQTQPGQQAFQPRLPFTFPSPIAPAPTAAPVPHSQPKPKVPAAPGAEPLTALQLPLQETPQKASPSGIVFEAKLTPIQPKPDSAPPPPSAAPDAKSAPRDETKNPETLSTSQTKPDRPIEAAASSPHTTASPHAVDTPAKVVMETPTITTPSFHIEKPTTAERIPEPARPALTSAPDLPDIPAPRTEPARDISFRIASTPTDAVDVKLVDRAGQIHVAVRSSDPVLTQSLQSNITDLASKLDKAGFQAETLIPNHTQPAQQSQQNNSFQQSLQDRRAPQQEFQQRKKRPAESNAVFTLNSQQEKS